MGSIKVESEGGATNGNYDPAPSASEINAAGYSSQPTARNSGNTLCHLSEFLVAIRLIENHVDVRKKISLDVVNDLFKGSPQVVDANEYRACQHQGKEC